jgi:PqqD family protein of HPr-rel-A system
LSQSDLDREGGDAARRQNRQRHRTAGSRRSRFEFYEDRFVFDPISGKFYRLNPTAAFVLRAIVEGARPEELPELLQSHFDIDHRSAVRDAELFVNNLAELGLLAEDMA